MEQIFINFAYSLHVSISCETPVLLFFKLYILADHKENKNVKKETKF